MNYKEQIEKLKAIVLGSAEDKVEEKEVVAEAVELEEAPAQEEVKDEAPSPEYVTLGQFNELKEDTKKFMESVTEMLSSAMEMINSTEKNAVPVEASKEEEEGEEVELAAEPVLHTPDAPQRTQLKSKIGAGAPKTAGDRARETWYNVINKD